MNQFRRRTLYIVQAAVIAALYVVLTALIPVRHQLFDVDEQVKKSKKTI